jgi:hypothetical protein
VPGRKETSNDNASIVDGTVSSQEDEKVIRIVHSSAAGPFHPE